VLESTAAKDRAAQDGGGRHQLKLAAEQDRAHALRAAEGGRQEADAARGGDRHSRLPEDSHQGISDQLLKWKAIEVAHELSKSPNAKIIVLGDKSGLPIILSDSK
jgi:hypothetical protein